WPRTRMPGWLPKRNTRASLGFSSPSRAARARLVWASGTSGGVRYRATGYSTDRHIAPSDVPRNQSRSLRRVTDGRSGPLLLLLDVLLQPGHVDLLGLALLLLVDEELAAVVELVRVLLGQLVLVAVLAVGRGEARRLGLLLVGHGGVGRPRARQQGRHPHRQPEEPDGHTLSGHRVSFLPTALPTANDTSG